MPIRDMVRKFMAQRADDSARPQAGIRFGIPWPLLIALCIILVCAVAWAFFMGLMVGRGQNPHSGIAAITGISTSQPAAESTEKAPMPGASAEEAPVAPVPDSGAAEETGAPRPAATQAQSRKPAQAAAPRAKPASVSNERYNYVFQTGAYRNEKEADTASARLKKSGFRSSVRKSGRVWLVTVSLRGSQRQVENLIQKMKDLKMGKPLQISRKEIGKK